MLLVLAGRAGFDGVVPGVVGPWGHLVQQQSPVGQQEQLHAKDAGACSNAVLDREQRAGQATGGSP